MIEMTEAKTLTDLKNVKGGPKIVHNDSYRSTRNEMRIPNKSFGKLAVL